MILIHDSTNMSEITGNEVQELSKLRYTNINFHDGDPVGVCIFIQATELSLLGIDLDKNEMAAYQLVSITGENVIRVMDTASLAESDLQSKGPID